MPLPHREPGMLLHIEGFSRQRRSGRFAISTKSGSSKGELAGSLDLCVPGYRGQSPAAELLPHALARCRALPTCRKTVRDSFLSVLPMISASVTPTRDTISSAPEPRRIKVRSKPDSLGPRQLSAVLCPLVPMP